jgi:hypothetical protein
MRINGDVVLNRVFRYSYLDPHIGEEDPLVERGDDHQGEQELYPCV